MWPARIVIAAFVCSSSSQVKGHLDYMRQMETILVAVGMPTREGAGRMPGAAPGVPAASDTQSDPVSGEDPEKPQEGLSSTTTADLHQEGEATATMATVTASANEELDKATVSEEPSEAVEVTEDGWDIPDISDLLDSLNEQDSKAQNCPEGENHDSVLCLTEDTVHEDTQCETETWSSEGEAAEDSEQNSWDWNTSWTTELSPSDDTDQTQTHYKSHDHIVTNGTLASAVGPHSLVRTGPTYSNHPITEHTVKTSRDSNDNIQ